MTTKSPAASTLKSKRRRSPVFIDEPIQWHLRTTKHDHCRWCGLRDLGYLGARGRVCSNAACGIRFELPIPAKHWFEQKLRGEEVRCNPIAAFTSYVRPGDRDLRTDLANAQFQSDNGRARTEFQVGFDTVWCFWHREGILPENEEGARCVAAGSPYWRLLLSLREQDVWVPDEPLNAMEVIAKAATDDPMFAIMRL